MSDQGEPFIGEGDRPTGFDLDTSISTLRVRDLATILGRLGIGQGKVPHAKFEGHSPLKEFFDKPFPEVLAPITARRPSDDTEMDRLIATVTSLAARVDEVASKVDRLDERTPR